MCDPGNVCARDCLHLIGGLLHPLPSTSIDRNQREKYYFFPSYLLNGVLQGYYGLQFGSLFLQGKGHMDFEQK